MTKNELAQYLRLATAATKVVEAQSAGASYMGQDSGEQNRLLCLWEARVLDLGNVLEANAMEQSAGR